MKARILAKQIAVLLFGVVVPLLVVIQAYQGISSLNNDVGYRTTTEQLIDNFNQAKKSLSTINDYSLFSLLYVEHANQKTMTNKQVMKVGIVHIGFAVISIGMMLIILGINDGGVEGIADVSGIKFDFKTGSTGVAVFVIGAIMATAGGVLKNEYQTSKIPDYVSLGATGNAGMQEETLKAYKMCRKQEKTSVESCFLQVFEQINKEAIE